MNCDEKAATIAATESAAMTPAVVVIQTPNSNKLTVAITHKNPRPQNIEPSIQCYNIASLVVS